MHPGPLGHRLLAAIVAHALETRLPGLGPVCGTRRQWVGGQGGEASGARHNARQKHATALRLAERCYANAEAIPLAAPPAQGSWSIVDEGGNSGVAKRGWLSTVANETLQLGPLPPLGRCLRVGVGFFARADPSQGGLRLSCEGCQCAPERGFWSSVITPFPLVQTNLLAMPEFGGERGPNQLPYSKFNVSITALTFFRVLGAPAPPAECRVLVTHLAPAPLTAPLGPAPETASRVRVDSLLVSEMECHGVG